jgi:hypothetical protein
VPQLDLLTARKLYHEQNKKARLLDKNLVRDLQHGWLLQYLLPLESMLHGRWEYWTRCQMSPGRLPDEPIPVIDFGGNGDEAKAARTMLETALGSITQSGGSNGWMGWSGSQNVAYLLDWLLFGFGHNGQKELPEEPRGCEGASMRLYQLFDLSPLLLWPYDHWAELLAEVKHGQGSGFFPTPHHVVEVMTRMTMSQGDHRMETVCDCCLGTGRMLLHASNYSLRLYGQDIDTTVLKGALVNGYLYAPWLVKPIAWLDQHALDQHAGELKDESAVQLSEAMTQVAPPHQQEQLAETELDAAGTAQTAPLLKRRPKTKTARLEAAGQMNLLEFSDTNFER